VSGVPDGSQRLLVLLLRCGMICQEEVELVRALIRGQHCAPGPAGGGRGAPRGGESGFGEVRAAPRQ
jgi:hypothetical protein